MDCQGVAPRLKCDAQSDQHGQTAHLLIRINKMAKPGTGEGVAPLQDAG